MAVIVLEEVTKEFPDGTAAVKDLNLDIRDGEFVVFVGPSGSGKSTALRMIAGLEETTSGTIRIGDRVVNDVSPRDRDIAMVFQNYALYPHMTVYDNMAFALKLRGLPRDELGRRVEDAAELLGIADLLQRKPRQLSGGQRQRVAMGRAIVREPAAFLMDEPLSNLDAKLRVQMRTEIGRLHQRLKTTTVYVTHDQVEAVTMADRVAVLRKGTLQQFDTPQNLYERPVNLFVAGFIGSPAMNMVRAQIARQNDRLIASFGDHQLGLPDSISKRLPSSSEGKEVILGVRPEAFEDPELAAADRKMESMEVEIGLVETLGSETIAYFDVGSPPVITEETSELAGAAADDSPEGRVSTFTARLHPNTAATNGQRMRLAVDAEKLYLFDPRTGKAIGR